MSTAGMSKRIHRECGEIQLPSIGIHPPLSVMERQNQCTGGYRLVWLIRASQTKRSARHDFSRLTTKFRTGRIDDGLMSGWASTTLSTNNSVVSNLP